jgi:ankyrin repeat protein
VSNEASNDANDDCTRRWKPAFKRSAWFTRGWTLQELIAPTSVEFFSHEGVFLGSRTTLEQTIYEITGIAIEALRGAPLSQFTKDERLSWASKRKTKRGEDAAYCLLGIFNVFIPPIYGEGRQNALARLEEQIGKNSKSKLVPLIDLHKHMLMDSLRFGQIDARHITIKRAHAKTCKWLLSNHRYRSWLDSSMPVEHHSFLWIRGKPGAGKSTLMKFALADATKTLRSTIVISFFFNARGDELEKSTLGMFRALILQLLEQIPELQSAFEALGIPASKISIEYEWSVEMLHKLLEEAVQRLTGTSVVCFIDALDECEEQQIRDMVAFFEHLGDLSVPASTPIQICFSSRHYPNITIQNGLSLVLEVQEGHSQDIIKYVESELKIGESKAAQQIRLDLVRKASGVFMWVVLVVDILRKEYDRGRVHALRKRLDEIPADLHELFSDILTRDSRDQEDLILCIQWVLYAKEPLSPEQLYYAILAGVEPDALGKWDPKETTEDSIRRFILDASKGLTEITRSGYKKVQFIHESVRDYFIKEAGLANIWPALKDNFEGQSHERIKTCCFNYMEQNAESLLETSERLDNLSEASPREAKVLRNAVADAFPLLKYAVQNILYHADRAEGARIAQQEFIRDFPMKRWHKFNNLIDRDRSYRYMGAGSILYTLAERNMSRLIRGQPFVTSCFDTCEERYGAPIFAAIATGSKEVVHEFVDAFYGDENEKGHNHRMYAQYYQDAKGQNLLGPGFIFPKGSIVRFLMNLGNEAIHSLALRACESKRNTKDYDRHMHLCLAAAGGHRAMVELLLNMSTDCVNSRTNDGSTPILLAAGTGHEATVELLLRTKGIDPNPKDVDGVTPILLAASNGHRNTVQMLLRNSTIDVNTKDNQGSTAILLAAKNGHKDTVELLLGVTGINPDPVNRHGSTPLLVAAANGHKDIVELLLGTGKVDVDAMDKIKSRPLLLATAHGYRDIVRLLLDTGKADVNAKDIKGYAALSLATLSGREDTVQVLLTSDNVDVNTTDSGGNTPIIIAARNGTKKVAELLLATGKVKVNTMNHLRDSALSLAIEHRHEDLVELLTTIGKADINQQRYIKPAPSNSDYRPNRPDPAVLQDGEEVGFSRFSSRPSFEKPYFTRTTRN